MLMRLYIAGALALGAGSAWADHDHHAVDNGHSRAFGASVTVVAASYDTMLYVGNYQGVQPAGRWSNGRFSAGASAALYRIERNGASYYGFGDLVMHGQAALLRREHVTAGIVAGVTVPVGDDQHGLGMGHVMLMPAAFGLVALDRVALTATAGYGYAIGDRSGHDHGMWPIVEPMNMQELTWSAAGEYSITGELHGGARVSGGVPIGDGDNRIIGAARVAWLGKSFTTAAELQVGIAGDPFTLRGVLSTGLAF